MFNFSPTLPITTWTIFPLSDNRKDLSWRKPSTEHLRTPCSLHDFQRFPINRASRSCLPVLSKAVWYAPISQVNHSSSGGISSSMYFKRVILISVASSPLRMSLTKCASICIWTCFVSALDRRPGLELYSSASVANIEVWRWCREEELHDPVWSPKRTISNAPLKTPHKMLENHNSSCAFPSSGSSTKSARGFSSKTSENCLLSADQLVTTGVMSKKILNPIYKSVSQQVPSHEF